MSFNVNSNLNINTLFSSMGTGSTGNGSSGLSSLLADYHSIRSGSYGKLLKAYYNKVDTETAKSHANSATNRYSTSTAADSSATIRELQSTTDDLMASGKALYTTGSKSVFNKKTMTDENGKTTTGYDTDAIYKKVQSFVDDYNSVLDAAEDSKDSKIANSVAGMKNYTKMEANMLGKVGITVNADQSLTMDADTFKKSDMSVAKSLFSGTGSYAYTISAKSAMANSYADLEANQANTYNKYGSYGSVYTQGSLYNSYF